MFNGYDPKDVVISWDNEHGLDVRELQKALRRKNGAVKIDLKSSGLAILRIEKPTEEAQSQEAQALQSYAKGIVEKSAELWCCTQFTREQTGKMIETLRECARNDFYAKNTGLKDAKAAIDAAILKFQSTTGKARP